MTISGSHEVNKITGLSLSGSDVLNIEGDAGALLYYYDPLIEDNGHLAGQTYNLANGVYLMPIPEPSAFSLVILGSLVVIFARSRHRV